MPKLILASSSPRRKELMKMLGFDFTTVPGKIEEDKYLNLPPKEMVQRLARAKVDDIAQLAEDTLIIAADTVVELNTEVLGKPRDKEDARQMLENLSGKKHRVITGIAVYNTINREIITDYDQTTVQMRKITPLEISGYISTGEPMDKAGSYGIQGLGGIFVEKINGSYYNVVGLPIHKLVLILNEFGISVF